MGSFATGLDFSADDFWSSASNSTLPNYVVTGSLSPASVQTTNSPLQPDSSYSSWSGTGIAGSDLSNLAGDIGVAVGDLVDWFTLNPNYALIGGGAVLALILFSKFKVNKR